MDEVGRFNFLNIHGTLRASGAAGETARREATHYKYSISHFPRNFKREKRTWVISGKARLRRAVYTCQTQQNIKLYHYPCKLKLPATAELKYLKETLIGKTLTRNAIKKSGQSTCLDEEIIYDIILHLSAGNDNRLIDWYESKEVLDEKYVRTEGSLLEVLVLIARNN